MNAMEGQTLRGIVRLLEELRVRDFTPHGSGEAWFDFTAGDGVLSVPRFRVRVVLDDNVVTVHVLSVNGICCWSVTFSDGTPVGVITGVIDRAIGRAAGGRAG
jgi:hypothetical protein